MNEKGGHKVAFFVFAFGLTRNCRPHILLPEFCSFARFSGFENKRNKEHNQRLEPLFKFG
jgi:hypothetical protein